MRILHISEGSLPDWRIEKAAFTAKKNSHVVLFAGTAPIQTDNKVFDNIYDIKWDFLAKYKIPYYWHLLKKQIKKILEDTNPDIIHAHQIIPAKLISEFKIPYIFDDHEYSSSHARIIYEAFVLQKDKFDTSNYNLRNKLRWLARTSVKKYTIRLWTKWEREIVAKVPTITVSNTIAADLEKLDNAKKVFVVPNFPLQNEISHFPNPKNSISSVYLGSDGLQAYPYPSRNMTDFINLFINKNIGKLYIIGWKNQNDIKNTNVHHKGFLSRSEFFQEMINHSIGLIPWKKHWSHKYVNPNKAYEYVHAGLFVLCTSDLKEVINTLNNNCDIFEDYEGLVSILKYYGNNPDELYKKRLKSYNFAKENLIWEKYERNIINAYKIC